MVIYLVLVLDYLIFLEKLKLSVYNTRTSEKVTGIIRLRKAGAPTVKFLLDDLSFVCVEVNSN